VRVTSARLSKRLAGLQCRTAFSRLRISARLILLVLGLALPLKPVPSAQVGDTPQLSRLEVVLSGVRSSSTTREVQFGKGLLGERETSPVAYRAPLRQALIDDNAGHRGSVRSGL